MIKDSIALIGFMGTGKTVVGKALALRLGDDYTFTETDNIVIEIAGKSIPEIFSEDGELTFRYYEIEACRRVSNLSKSVVSCGGGVILNPINIENLKKKCYIILLTASIEEIYKRIMREGKKKRPIINKKDPLKEIKKVLKERQPLYKDAADYIIDTTGLSIIEIVDKLFELLNKIGFH